MIDSGAFIPPSLNWRISNLLSRWKGRAAQRGLSRVGREGLNRKTPPFAKAAKGRGTPKVNFDQKAGAAG